MKKIRFFLINYAVLVTILVTIEIIGHLSYRIIKGKYLFQNNTNENTFFKEHPYLVGTPKENFRFPNLPKGFNITTDGNGHRVTKNYVPSKDAINIVCIGGSTTFATGVPDKISWPYILQQKLGENYNVINLGVPGYSTLEGIIQLVTTVPELKPDILIIYQGWNDIRSYHAPNKSPDYLWHGKTQKSNLSVNKKTSITEYSFINFIAGKIGNKISKSKELENNISSHRDSYIDEIYVRNLKTIQVLCNQLQVKQIYIPQVLNLEEYTKSVDVSDSWTPYISNKSMPELIKKINSLMSQTIKKGANTTVVDSILSKYKWNSNHFVDVGHFSEDGGKQFSDIIISHLNHLENFKIDN
ncbi:SGNH/GDSL hydrolase family protein [Jejuia spongiicola]|uniref:GDSL-type esterase/lipase family protein n=1 Tax=Jejuia spongiicola TaxID=2942207 RepID=A0ABT0QBR2_9FLAO|nr:GDSL-type esterase/lipase family protein [Jejuia spongiicola]MCL6294417.1 GDSL-type esterase/lipase family protein [Jejuia spongiicola]